MSKKSKSKKKVARQKPLAIPIDFDSAVEGLLAVDPKEMPPKPQKKASPKKKRRPRKKK